ncbi:glycosyltransferase [Gluconobacter japonicus]|uniref:glycosyltransferase family 4 protein n=1 Tax=Gluconobacter japonicus TaxID=376620 RepID=UPI0024AD8EDD|nr:glycosyltransferase [Gluconobacter japonicus]MDI6653821.1 glycosyltransferase [Gluconobacter japonicus]
MAIKTVLVWQWGKRGAGPRIAVDLANGLTALPDVSVRLCLSEDAEILHSHHAPQDALVFKTYRSAFGLLGRFLQAPLIISKLFLSMLQDKPDIAICAMPAPLDVLMAHALRRAGVKVVTIVHDARAHPGDGYPLQMFLQKALISQSSFLVTFSKHVATVLSGDTICRGKPVVSFSHPPFVGTEAPPPFSHGGKPRLLMFGRLLPYKGLDLLADALPQLEIAVDCRVIGRGPQSPELLRLSEMKGVIVENRWVPEDELSQLIAWADVLLLPYREASQSGVGAMAVAGGRYVVATNVGGLSEQFSEHSQAMLCEPDPASIARTIAQLLNAPPPVAPVPDSAKAWQNLGQKILTVAG